MQYILTEKEFKDLMDGIKIAENKNTELIQKLCVQVAENKPILFWGNKDPEIWGCCRHGDDDGNYAYCDECPVQNDCPEPHKAWSK